MTKLNNKNVKKIVHLVPYDGVGGVETAARSMINFQNEKIEFKVDFIFKGDTKAVKRRETFNPLPILSAVKRVAFGGVDVVITSLWRSAIVGILAKILRPRLELVVFIHSAKDFHWLDFIFTRLAISFAYQVWADSEASLCERFPNLAQGRTRVISFVTRRFEAMPKRDVSPDFIFWGRIDVYKGLDRSLRIFAEIVKEQPNARFWIIGPDRGVLQCTQQLCKSLELCDHVRFLGEATLTEIANQALQATFYLQTSQIEGMAMSVVEAMQMGLVPIVTPVGEIPYYCSQGFNALIIKSDMQAVEDVRNLLNNNEKYQSIRLNAIATWKEKPLYADSVMLACEDIFESEMKN